MELITKVYSPEAFNTVYECLVQKLFDMAITVEVLFGFAWGNEVYEGRNVWVPQEVRSQDIRELVEAQTRKGFGRIGDDDLFITLKGSGVKVHICHERDLHIEYEAEDAIVTELKKAVPAEDWKWQRKKDGEKWQKIEGDSVGK